MKQKAQARAVFALQIKLGNDMMQTPAHVADALRDLAERFRGVDTFADERSGSRAPFGASDGPIFDENGNTVGRWEVLP